jgi:cyclase
MTVRTAPEWGTGLQEVGPGIYAYLQYDGSWGISNAGFVEGPDGLLVIDALMVAKMAQGFINEIRRVSAKPFRHLVNTHSHPDHTGGNRLFSGAEIISHTICREEMMRGIQREAGQSGAAPPRNVMPEILRTPAFERMFEMVREDVGPEIKLPTLTYDDKLTIFCGDTRVDLLYFGLAHTFGDTLLYFPEQKLLFAGDVRFFYSTPLAGQGKIGGWLNVIERVKELDVDTIVPGHGPPGRKQELDDVREYFEFIRDQARKASEAGIDEKTAAEQIDLGPYKDWLDPERLFPNVGVAYREFRGEI